MNNATLVSETPKEDETPKEEETPGRPEDEKDYFKHLIGEGDTLIGISLKYDVPVSFIVKFPWNFYENYN